MNLKPIIIKEQLYSNLRPLLGICNLTLSPHFPKDMGEYESLFCANFFWIKIN